MLLKSNRIHQMQYSSHETMDGVSDNSMRYSMIGVGLLSGSASGISKTWLRRLSSLYQLIMFGVSIVYVIVSLLPQGYMIYASKIQRIGVISTIVWSVQTLIISCIFLFLSHWRSGLTKYYEALDECINNLHKLPVSAKTKGFVRKCRGIVLLGWIVGVTPILNMIAVAIESSVKSPAAVEYYRVFSNLLPLITICVPLLQWAFSTAYIIHVSYTLWFFIGQFNDKMKADILKSCDRVLDNLHAYRDLHLKLCEAVETANGSIRLILGPLFLFSTVETVLILYALTYLKSITVGVYTWLTFCLFGGFKAAILAVVIFFADRLASATTEVHGHLLHLYKPGMVITSEQLYQMQLFLSRAEKPEGFSISGLMNLNKEFGVTIVGLLATYYIVMDQMVNPFQ